MTITSEFQSTRPVRGATVGVHRRLHLGLFQSTRPVRGATQTVLHEGGCLVISIHAPRAGRDSFTYWIAESNQNFNPRAPCGARRFPWSSCSFATRFQSTRPVRGATEAHRHRTGPTTFQSTRPVRGATNLSARQIRARRHFNPRAPCGARPKRMQKLERKSEFQSTRPVRGATAKVYKITLHTFATKGNS